MRRERFLPFYDGGHRVGWILHEFAEKLSAYPEVFRHEDRFSLRADLSSFDAKTEAIAAVVEDLHNRGDIGPLYGEIYPVTATHMDAPGFLIDRAVCSYFGIRTFGQHLNGYVGRGEDMKMWIGKRASDRGYEPGKLDQLVAGGFPYGISAMDNLRKECMEEAGIEQQIADRAIATGANTCCYENAKGVKPETIYLYDLELSEEFVPENTDGEVEAFMLMPIREVAERVRDTQDFKLNCNLVVIDFLIRHGFLTSDDEDYDLLVSGLHQ